MKFKLLIFLLLPFFIASQLFSDESVTFVPYNGSNYTIYEPGEIVTSQDGKFLCLRAVGNDQPLPTPSNLMSNTFWKIISPAVIPSKLFQPWNGYNYHMYQPGDMTQYNQQYYICLNKVANTVLPSSSPMYWELLGFPYQLFISQVGIPDFSIYNNSNYTLYHKDDRVLYNSTIYVCQNTISNANTPDELSTYWQPFSVNPQNSAISVLIILTNPDTDKAARVGSALKIYNTALALGYNVVLLADNINSTDAESFSPDAVSYYEEAGFTQFSSETGSRIFIDSLSNIKNKIKELSPEIIYYIGDGNIDSNGECNSIDCFNGEITSDDISSISFNKNTTFISNACHGALLPFVGALQDAGVLNYASGMTYLSDFDALPTAVDIVTTFLLNPSTNLNDAFKSASSKMDNLLEQNSSSFPSGFNIGVWGYFANNSNGNINFYCFQLQNYNFINFVDISGNGFFQLWPFQASNLQPLSYPSDFKSPQANEKILIMVNRTDDNIPELIVNLYSNIQKNNSGSVILLIPMKVSITDSGFSNSCLSTDTQAWTDSGINPDIIAYNTSQNILKYLKSDNLLYAYYIGDSNSIGENWAVDGLETTSPPSNDVIQAFFNTADFASANIQFNDKQIWIMNACLGITGKFPVYLYNAGLRNFAAGFTELKQPFDSNVGLNAFGNTLTGMEISTALKKAISTENSLYGQDPINYPCGIWGIVEGDNAYLLSGRTHFINYLTSNTITSPATINSWPFPGGHPYN